ncbi:MAG: HPr family phosphocarrier protein [Smithella sp.]|nr:HPr family phosphocarrier protein [Syntrophaceae bacterium]
MVEIKTFELKNKLGMHARPAAAFVKIAQKFKSDIYLEHNGQTVNGKSILGLLTMACPYKGKLTIRVDGPDVEEAMKALGALIENKFGED